MVYSRTDRVADAVAVYRRASRLAPNEPGLWLNLGQAHFLPGRAYYEATLFDEAAAAFCKAREPDPALPSLHLELVRP